MKTCLIVTVIGADRVGIVDRISSEVTAHGGNWGESRLVRLAGRFAGVISVVVPEGNAAALRDALVGFISEGLTVVVKEGLPDESDETGKPYRLQLAGGDHEGIVQDISKTLARLSFLITELNTEFYEAPFSGSKMFKAVIDFLRLEGADIEELQRDLERLADDLIVEISVADLASQEK